VLAVLLAVLLELAMPIIAHPCPPQIIQIHREALKPGTEDAYQEVETKTAQICAKLARSHPYLAIESLTGPKEVWFLNGYESPAEHKKVVDDYAKNAKLMTALEQNSRRKAGLTKDGPDPHRSRRGRADRRLRV
jgi:hypothetical protein